MGRIAKMPFTYYDQQKKRHFAERRIPDDVQSIIFGDVRDRKRKHTFPQLVDRETANDLSTDIVKGWKAEWEALRAGIAPCAVEPPPHGHFIITKTVKRLGQPGQPLALSGHLAHLKTGRRGEELIVEHFPIESVRLASEAPDAGGDAPPADTGKCVDYRPVVDAWAKEYGSARRTSGNGSP